MHNPQAKILVGKLKVKNNFLDIGVDGRILLKCN
jgi:hypothetical protein